MTAWVGWMAYLLSPSWFTHATAFTWLPGWDANSTWLLAPNLGARRRDGWISGISVSVSVSLCSYPLSSQWPHPSFLVRQLILRQYEWKPPGCRNIGLEDTQCHIYHILLAKVNHRPTVFVDQAEKPKLAKCSKTPKSIYSGKQLNVSERTFGMFCLDLLTFCSLYLYK